MTASFCLHFALALVCAWIFVPPSITPSVQSISLAQVTLKPPTKTPAFLDADDLDAITERGADQGESLPGEVDAPMTAASLKLTESGHPGMAANVPATGAALPRTPRSRGNLTGSGGNTQADERLMQKDIERSLASKPPSGPSTEVTLFGGKLTGHSFVFVIDRSASTAKKHYAVCAEIERECVKAIESLPAANRFQVVLYNDRVSITHGLRMATNPEKDAAKERMIRYSPSGGTMHMDALRAALLLRSNVVCWFSDGDDPYLTPREVEELALLAARSKTSIHAWRLGKQPSDPGSDFMRALAERTGGEFYEGISGAR